MSKQHTIWIGLGVLASGLLALGCDDERTSEGTANTGSVVDDRPLAACERGVPTLDRVKLSSDDVSAFAVGPCGHVAFTQPGEQEYTTRMQLTDLRGEPVDLGLGSQPSFDRTGALFAWRRSEDDGLAAVVKALDSDEEWAEPISGGRIGFGLDRAGASEPRSIAWICEQDRLRVLGRDGVWSEVDPGYTCQEIHAGAGGVGLVRGDGVGGMRYVNLSTGASRQVEGLEYTWGYDNASDTERRDGFLLSDDGTALLHQVIRYEACGDTFCELPSPVTTAFDLVANRPVADVPAYIGDERLRAHPQALRDHHAMLFSASPNSSVLTAGRELAVLNDMSGLHLFKDAARVLVSIPVEVEDARYNREQLALVNLESGAQEDWLEVQDLENLQVSEGEQAVAFCHFTRERVTYPDRPNVSHTQVWALSLWTPEGGVREKIIKSDQPMRPHWVGDDGRALVGGGVFTAPLPVSAPNTPERLHGLHLIDPTGEIVATWEELGSIRQIEEIAPGVLLMLLWRDRTLVLERLDLNTQERLEIVSGEEIEWGMDEARELLVYRVTPKRAEDATERLPADLWAVSLERLAP